MELGLELMAAVGADHLDAEWKLGDDMVDEVDSAGLIMPVVDLQGPDARGVIDGSVDEARPGRPRTIEDDQVAAVIERTLRTTPADATHWSLRSMAAETCPCSKLGNAEQV